MKNINKIICQLLNDTQDNSEINYDENKKIFYSINKKFTKKNSVQDFFVNETNSDHITSKQEQFYEEIKSKNFNNKSDLSKKLNDILENMVLRNPDQWIWTHDRWK